MKKLFVKSVKKRGDNIIIIISKKRKGCLNKKNRSKKQLYTLKKENFKLNERLSRLRSENNMLKTTKNILEEEIERLRNIVIEKN